MSASTSESSKLLEQILASFVAKSVNVDDLPDDDPTAKLGKRCGELFTDGVDVLRSLIPNDRIRAIARVVWDLVGNKHVLITLGPDVPTLSFTAMRHGNVLQGLVMIPKEWPQMVENDTSFMQLGAILFVGVQIVDFCNDRLLGDQDAAARTRAYEAELLITLRQTLPSWKPNDYQRQILARYPDGLDTTGVVLYPYKPYEASQEST